MIRAIQYGVGAIGSRVVKAIAEKPWLKLIGEVDVDESKVGRDLGYVAGLNRETGIVVSRDLSEALKMGEADVVLHTTSSWLRVVEPQIMEIVDAGLNVVSTCEELSYPWRRNPEAARRIDEAAKKAGVTVLGTGVNPGFVLDTLILTLTGVCLRVDRIEGLRVVNASTRRYPLQRKIGSGMTVKEFQRAVRDGRMGHVGLRESFDMIADSLSWSFDRVDETIEPVVASREVVTEFFRVKPGRVVGVSQSIRGLSNGVERLKLNLRMYLDAENPRDLIKVEGVPNLEFEVKGGIPGDEATVAITLNMIPRVLDAEPGLKTMKELSIPIAWLKELSLKKRSRF
ncbi:TPA: dihydrodipicolinate reductase [Candidatus Bathyarchaeota archaeon]|nr:dihydrodipicolinate reductase [Candidatus Bathyarchaeota archaeon]